MSMLERLSGVEEHQKDFYLNLYAHVVRSVFDRSADIHVHDLVARKTDFETIFSDYLSQPKTLGDMSEASLAIVASRACAIAAHPSTPVIARAKSLELGGSAFWEIAYTDTVKKHNAIDGVEGRLENIEMHEILMSRAAELRPVTDVHHHHLQMRAGMTRIFQDIVAGDITSDSVEELLGMFRAAKAGARDIANHGDRYGFIGEVTVLEYFWRNYNGEGDSVAIPATVRGGSGHYMPDQTHDIDILKQRKDHSWVTLVPIEVKKQRIKSKHLSRYTASHLAQVWHDGSVTINGDHRALPGSNL